MDAARTMCLLLLGTQRGAGLQRVVVKWRRNEKNKKWAEEKTLLKENKHLPAEGKLKTENPHGMQGQCKGRTSKLGKQTSAPVRANNPNRL